MQIFTMDTNTAIPLLLSFLLLYVWYKIFNSFYIRSYKSNSKLKPLMGIPLLKFALHTMGDMDNTLQALTNLFRKYSPLPNIRLFNTSFVILTDVADVQTLLSSKYDGHLEKADAIYDIALSGIDGVGLATAPPDKWITRKKLISKGFTYKSLEYYNSKMFNKHAKAMVEKLRRRNDDMTGYPLADDLNNCMLNNILESVFGLDVNVNPEISSQMCDSVNILLNVVTERLQNLWTLSSKLWRFHPSYYTSRRVTKYLDGVIRNMIHNFRKQKIHRKEGNGVEGDEMGENSSRSILELLENSGLNEQEIIIETKTIVAAGYETTATATHFLVFMLALHQEHQKLCRAEVDAVFKESHVTFSEISELKHLEKCILETLRLFPIVPLFARKLRKEFVSESGVTIPSGENVLIYIPTLHTNPEFFPNPEVFDPERFTAENVKKRNPYAYVSFSLGRRNCIGYKYAMTEIKTVIAHLLWNFEIHTTDKLEDVPTHLVGLLRPARDYNFILKKREH